MEISHRLAKNVRQPGNNKPDNTTTRALKSKIRTTNNTHTQFLILVYLHCKDDLVVGVSRKVINIDKLMG